MIDVLVVLAKEPLPGRVKTRLHPHLSFADAAVLAGAALADTIDAIDATPAARHVLAFDGDARPWLRPGWSWHVQPSGGLDGRLVAALEASGPGPSLLVGMDTPQLRPDQLRTFDPARYDACLGPAADGGYWAIGFADTARARRAITGVPMSSATTGAAQLARLRTLGLRVQLLDELVDVDTVAELETVAGAAPRSRFARAVAALPLARAGTVDRTDLIVRVG